MNSRISKATAYLVLLILSVMVFCYWASKKEVWFCDEIYTYESANGIEAKWPDQKPDVWMSGSDVTSYLAADGPEFRFKAISDVLYGDHVPLYFWIFRVVSLLFFRGSASVWIGLSINLFFFILGVTCCYFFVRRYIGDIPAAALIFLVAAFSRIGACQYTVLRMYMMMLAAEIVLLILGIRIVNSEKWSHITFFDFVLLYVVTLVGLMTHYDFWIFYGFSATFCCLFLLTKAMKRWKTLHGKALWSYQAKLVYVWCITFAGAILTLDRLFPYWKWNLHKGKGESALSSLMVLSREKFDNIFWGFRRLIAVLFGERVPFLPMVVCFYLVITVALVMLKRKERLNEATALVVTMLVSVAYRLVVCYTLPDVREERYLWCGITVEALCFGYSLIVLIQTFVKAKTIRWVIGCALFIVIGILNTMNFNNGINISYLYHPDKDIPALEAHSDIPWVVFGPKCGVYSYYDWTIPEELCFITEEETEEDEQAVGYLKDKESFILYVYEDLLDEAIDFVNRVNRTECSAEYLTQSANLKVYVVK